MPGVGPKHQVDDVTWSAAESNVLTGLPGVVTFAAAAAASTVAEVTITVKDANGDPPAKPLMMDVWLSDAATGAGLTGTTASGTVTAKSASGIVITTYTAKKALRVQTLANGTFVLEITDSAKTAFFVCAQNPGTGATEVATVLASGDYGA